MDSIWPKSVDLQDNLYPSQIWATKSADSNWIHQFADYGSGLTMTMGACHEIKCHYGVNKLYGAIYLIVLSCQTSDTCDILYSTTTKVERSHFEPFRASSRARKLCPVIRLRIVSNFKDAWQSAITSLLALRWCSTPTEDPSVCSECWNWTVMSLFRIVGAEGLVSPSVLMRADRTPVL